MQTERAIEAAAAGRRRPVQTGSMFFLPVSVPLTGTANESSQNNYTLPATNDLEIIGGISDIESAHAKFTLNKRPIWSDDNIPVPTVFGQPDSQKPIMYHQRPLYLRSGERIRADVLNVNGEDAATLVYVARQVGRLGLGPVIESLQDRGQMNVQVIDSQFSGVPNEEKRKYSTSVDYDFLLTGLHTNLSDATIRISGIDGLAWMNDFVPVWALAGKATSAQPVQFLHRPYLIPRGFSILIEFKNAGSEAAGKLWLYGQRLDN